MMVMSIGIFSIWLKEIISSKRTGSFFNWRDGENLMWPHITVELLTAAMLMLSGIGMFAKTNWASILGFYALGSLFYASLNSLSWTLADKKRWLYSVPMVIGLAGSIVLLVMVINDLT